MRGLFFSCSGCSVRGTARAAGSRGITWGSVAPPDRPRTDADAEALTARRLKELWGESATEEAVDGPIDATDSESAGTRNSCSVLVDAVGGTEGTVDDALPEEPPRSGREFIDMFDEEPMLEREVAIDESRDRSGCRIVLAFDALSSEAVRGPRSLTGRPNTAAA